jgi:hypothetical protein
MENSQKILLGTLGAGDNQEHFDIVAQTDSFSDYDWFTHYISIYFNYDNQVVLVRRCIVGAELVHLQKELEDWYAGKRRIPKECVGFDLGLLWNEHWQKIALAESVMQNVDSWDWVGANFLFLQSNSNGKSSNNTFLYQDELGNYVLQISSCFPYFFIHDKCAIAYGQWLPNYKILYRKNIERVVIEKWIKQLKDMCVYYRKHNHMHPEIL